MTPAYIPCQLVQIQKGPSSYYKPNEKKQTWNNDISNINAIIYQYFIKYTKYHLYCN